MTERKKDQSGENKLSHYLLVETSMGNSSQIPFDEYKEVYERSIARNRPIAPSINVGDSGQVDQVSSVPSVSSDLNPVLSLVLERLNVSSDNRFNNEQEFFIQSQLAEFLELPWESAVENAYIYREVDGADIANEKQDTENGFMVLMSHAHQPGKDNIGNDVNDEITKIFDHIIKNNKHTFRIDEVFFLKHGTRLAITSVDWSKFKYLHIVLHGEEDGRLCLEKSTNYDQIDHISKNDFIQLLHKDPRPYFVFIFLSFCFSGGGAETSSLAFDLVRTGIAENVLAYMGGVGSPSAKKFSEIFYHYLTYGDMPRLAYRKTVDRYKSEDPYSQYLPMFFMRKTI